VISRTSRRGGSPEVSSAFRIASRSVGLLNCSGDRLIATCTSCGQAAACMQASRSAHSPSGTMSPISSATGMNEAGGTIPRVGCGQRMSASKPVIAPLSASNSG
jgi:hypothetical protein